jgi:hypothetical protein
MSTSSPPVAAKNEIRIISHSGLFYWWPVWAVCFLMAIFTWMTGELLATVPEGSRLGRQATGEVIYIEPDNIRQENPPRTTLTLKGQDILIAPEGSKDHITGPGVKISTMQRPGVIFVAVLLLVIVITNIPLRGLWSVIVIVVIVSAVIILALLGAWENILGTLGLLDIRINLGGYVLIGGVLFGIWLIVFLFFDQQVYMVFTPGQFRVRLEIGEGETAYDTTGMTLQKQRSDLFRHWVLGLGSGDLIVRTSGAQAHQFDLHNVLFVGRKVKEIEQMLRSRPVVANPSA